MRYVSVIVCSAYLIRMRALDIRPDINNYLYTHDNYDAIIVITHLHEQNTLLMVNNVNNE